MAKRIEQNDRLTPETANEAVRKLNERRADYLSKVTGVTSEYILRFLTVKTDTFHQLVKSDPYDILMLYMAYLGIYVRPNHDSNPDLETNICTVDEMQLDCDFYQLFGDPKLRLAQLHAQLGEMRAIILLRLFHQDCTCENLKLSIEDSLKEFRSSYAVDSPKFTYATALLRQYLEIEVERERRSLRSKLKKLIGNLRKKFLPQSILIEISASLEPSEPVPSKKEFFDQHMSPEYILNTVLNFENIPLKSALI